MTKPLFTLIVAVVLTLSVGDVLAQPYVLGTYAVCDITRENRADQLVEQVMSGILDDQVAAGTIAAWGWLAHHDGGQWRRVLYTVGNDLGDLEAARTAFVDKLVATNSSAALEFSSICNRHDDYIWSWVTGSGSGEQVAQARPSAGLSIYFECDWSKNARIDELMGMLAPTANKMVADGRLRSWAFYRHTFGGKYTRLFLIDSSSHGNNLEAIVDLGNAMAAEHGDAFTEFQSLCNSHQDYMWDIKMARP